MRCFGWRLISACLQVLTSAAPASEAPFALVKVVERCGLAESSYAAKAISASAYREQSAESGQSPSSANAVIENPPNEQRLLAQPVVQRLALE